MNLLNELKPVRCGCGGKAIIYINGACQAKIYCEKCGIESNVFTTKYEAITAWNMAMGQRIAKVDSLILTSIPPQTIYKCRNCWNEVKIQDNYCSKCGAKLEWSKHE